MSKNKVEHIYSDKCWCNPEVETFENGNKIIIHNDITEILEKMKN